MTHVDGGGTAFAEVAEGLGLEGVVAKRTGSKYQPGRRSPDWRKIKLTNTQDCVILGWTPARAAGRDVRRPAGRRLRRGQADLDRAGRHGLHARTLDRVLEALEPLSAQRRRSATPSSPGSGCNSSSPTLVCEVEYLEITKSTKKMRAPSFKGLREDKAPDESVLELPRGR